MPQKKMPPEPHPLAFRAEVVAAVRSELVQYGPMRGIASRVARKYGLTDSTVIRWARIAGLKLDRPKAPKKPTDARNAVLEQVKAELAMNGYTFGMASRIGRQFGVSHQSVLNWARQAGFEMGRGRKGAPDVPTFKSSNGQTYNVTIPNTPPPGTFDIKPHGVAHGPSLGSLTLPNWVYNMVNDLVKHEDEHPDPGEAGSLSDYYCVAHILELVPDDVRETADIIRTYVREL